MCMLAFRLVGMRVVGGESKQDLYEDERGKEMKYEGVRESEKEEREREREEREGVYGLCALVGFVISPASVAHPSFIQSCQISP